MTDYNDPAFTYWRWYTNNTGAEPNADWWQEKITEDGINWIKVENHSFLNDSVTLFIPELKYLACSDKTLPICSYGIKISKISQSRPITHEIVLNNCYIGTMGCNEYNKGLELNQSSCKKY